MISSSLLTGEDKKIRMQWLINMLFFFIGFSFLFSILALYFPTIFPRDIHSWGDVFNVLFKNICKNGLFVYLSYEFAYKRFGTKWLAGCLISGLIFLLVYIAGAFQLIDIKLTDYPQGLNVRSFLIDISMMVWWLITCWRLRELNKRLHREENSQQVLVSANHSSTPPQTKVM